MPGNVISKIYVMIKKGAAFDPISLVGESAVRVDVHVDPAKIPTGAAVCVVHAFRSHARTTLESADGLVVSPPLHRPLQQKHLDAFAHCGVVQGDTGYDLGEKLFTTHGLEWLHPENGPDY